MERKEQKEMIDVIYLIIGLVITAAGALVIMYIDYLKFKKWFDEQQEPEPYQFEEPVRISKRQAEIFNRTMRRINRDLKNGTVTR